MVDTVGHAETFAAAGAAIEPGGTVVELGLAHAPVPIHGLTLLHKEARLQWANCYSTRASGQSDFEESMRLLQQDPALWSSMLTDCVPLNEIRRGFELAANRNLRHGKGHSDDELTRCFGSGEALRKKYGYDKTAAAAAKEDAYA